MIGDEIPSTNDQLRECLAAAEAQLRRIEVYANRWANTNAMKSSYTSALRAIVRMAAVPERGTENG